MSRSLIYSSNIDEYLKRKMWQGYLAFFIVLIFGLIVLIVMISGSMDSNNSSMDDLTSALTFQHQYLTLFQNKNHSNIDIPLFYINLDCSKDRNEFMRNQIQTHNVTDWKRITGIDGKDDSTISYTNLFNNMSSSEIGCTLSHLKAIKHAYDQNLDYVLILEDDVSFDFVPLWDHPLSWYIDNIEHEWTILQLYSNYDYKNLKCTYFNPKGNAWAAAAYII